MMKLLGILGSMRKNGNTEIMLDRAFETARDQGCTTTKITLRDKTIGPCDGCMGCAPAGMCVVKDDMQEIYAEIKAADGIIWATPVYFWSMSGLTKIAMDRTFALGFPKLQQVGKIGGLIVVAGSRGCMNTANAFHMYFNYNHMFFAEYAWGYAGEKGGIANQKIAMGTSELMVEQMMALHQAGLSYPDGFDFPMPRNARQKYGDQNA